jgi:hypothetical protein
VVSSDSSETAETKPASSDEFSPATRQRLRFYRVRNRIYSGLLVFVAIAGLPVIAVPVLRHRLADRVHVLRAAISGGYRQVLTARVGENNIPFPSEYERPMPHRNYPQLPPSITGASPQQPIDVGQVYPQRAPKKGTRAAAEPQAPATADATQPKPAQEAQAEETAAEDAAPVYKQGKMEQEVYDILLKTDEHIAGLVQGKNATLHFKSWDVAKRQEDLYWVRIIFTQMPAKTDLECIWQVQAMSKQIMPLNYNARSLPKS